MGMCKVSSTFTNEATVTYVIFLIFKFCFENFLFKSIYYRMYQTLYLIPLQAR